MAVVLTSFSSLSSDKYIDKWFYRDYRIAELGKHETSDMGRLQENVSSHGVCSLRFFARLLHSSTTFAQQIFTKNLFLMVGTVLGVLGMVHVPQVFTAPWRQTHNDKLTAGIRANSWEPDEGRFVAPGELGMVNPGKPVSSPHLGTAGSGNVGMICMKAYGSSIQPLSQAQMHSAGFSTKLSSRMG